MSRRLPDVVAEYLTSRRAEGYKANTLRNDQRTFDHLIAVIGPIQVGHIDDHHIDKFLSAMQAKAHSAGTMNIHLATLRGFWKFLHRRRYYPQGKNPIAHRRWYKQAPKSRLRIPQSEWGRVLDAAPHPRDRVVVALGLYLFLRQGEVAALRLSDLDLEGGSLAVTIEKTSERDVMPISAELDTELRKWLWFYRTDAPRPLEATDYLVPAKGKPHMDTTVRPPRPIAGTGHVKPDVKIQKVEDCVKRALVGAGYPVADEAGRTTREGVHTLRRSGARAYFDQLCTNGYDGALRTVQSMLHHANSTMTERYLGLDLDISRRNEMLRGRPMFQSAPRAEVVQIRQVRETA